MSVGFRLAMGPHRSSPHVGVRDARGPEESDRRPTRSVTGSVDRKAGWGAGGRSTLFGGIFSIDLRTIFSYASHQDWENLFSENCFSRRSSPFLERLTFMDRRDVRLIMNLFHRQTVMAYFAKENALAWQPNRNVYTARALMRYAPEGSRLNVPQEHLGVLPGRASPSIVGGW